MGRQLEATIGIEVHAELATASKMFCSCPNNPHDLPPNTAVCPICLAHPGTLPYPNAEAVRHVVRVGLAIGGDIAWDMTEFERKNYFYPDLPKGFQLSQFAFPLVRGGVLAGVAIERIHLEEDTARTQHDASRGVTLLDFNRAGVPLMELVTRPVIHTPEEAVSFARELQLLLQTLGASSANMERGEMRVEANVSVASAGGSLGTKVEVKNLNSFRAVERAIAHEIARQSALVARGEEVVQETRGWDEVREVTIPQRRKEEAHDYRYFPEPDIPSLSLRSLAEHDASWREESLRASLPELPWERRSRYEQLGLPRHQIEQLVSSLDLAHFYDATLAALSDEAGASQGDEWKQHVRLAANYLLSDIVGGGGVKRLRPEQLAEAVYLYCEGALSSRGVKDLLALCNEVSCRRPLREEAQDRNLLQEGSDEALRHLAQQVVDQHPGVVEDYLRGKEAAIQYLVGQGMRLSRGSAHPQKLREAIKKIIENK